MTVAVIRNGKLVKLSPDEGAKYTLKLLKEGKIRYNPKKHFWDSNNGKGWKGESERHQMSAYGIKSGRKDYSKAITVDATGKFKWKNKKNAIYGVDSKGKVQRWERAKIQVARDKIAISKLDDVLFALENQSVKVAIEKMNEIKKEIRTNGELDFIEMNGRTMAYSILSDAQESLNYGSRKNAELFINQAKDLIRGNYKKEGNEITFPDGEFAIF